MSAFAVFILLQAMDLATTVVALGMGAYEQNPLLSQIMAMGPGWGLLLSKVVVIGIAGIGAFLQKQRGIRRANAVFALVVVWNLSIITRLALAH